MAVGIGYAAVKRACPWPGKDLNRAEADALKLGRKWILIDHNLADGLFVWNRLGGETVNKHLRAVGAGSWTSQRIQLGRQFVRIVRECVQIFAADHPGALVAAWVRV